MFRYKNGLTICAVLTAALLTLTGIANADIADFDDLTLAADSYWYGADSSGSFTSGNASFNNNYNTTYGSWDGFAYSNRTDTSLYEWSSAQFNAITGTGQGDSANYGVGYMLSTPPTITLNSPTTVNGMYITNNNYAYYSMLNGDGWAKKFGGADGSDPDWFRLTITGKNPEGTSTGPPVDFYLADFRSTDSQDDYIVNTWQYVDLSSLGNVKTIEFALSSSDVGIYGMNTPAYFVIDSIVPEPLTITLLGLGSLLIVRKRS